MTKQNRDDHYADTKMIFEKVALENNGYYDTASDDSPGYTLWQKRMMLIANRFIDKYIINDAKVQTVLDVGCGNGDFVFGLYKKHIRLRKITGCDFAEDMVRLANKKNNSFRTINFIASDVLSLTFMDKVFDLTICINALHHIKPQDITVALTELSRVTGRYLLLEIKDSENFYNKYISSKTVYGLKLYPVGKQHVIKALSSFGFNLVHRKGIFGLEMFSPRLALLFKRNS